MPELDQTLRELAAETHYPPTPDLAARVAAAIPGRRQRRLVVVALAAAAVTIATGIAFAVPPARSAILDWLGFGPIRIERVSTLPRVPKPAGLELGRPTTLAGARRLMGFRILTLRQPPGPPGVFVDERSGEVTLVYGRLLLSELRGHGVFVAQKVVGPGTHVEEVRVAGQPGLWLAGRPHLFAYLDPQGGFRTGRVRLAGNTLLWEHGLLVLRLEGAETKTEALRLAASVS